MLVTCPRLWDEFRAILRTWISDKVKSETSRHFNFSLFISMDEGRLPQGRGAPGKSWPQGHENSWTFERFFWRNHWTINHSMRSVSSNPKSSCNLTEHSSSKFLHIVIWLQPVILTMLMAFFKVVRVFDVSPPPIGPFGAFGRGGAFAKLSFGPYIYWEVNSTL